MSNAARPAVLITGAAQRIGRAIAQCFAAAGWHVVIHYRASSEAAEALARSLSSAETICCDLADSEAAYEMVIELAHRLTDWRALINNASIFQHDSADRPDPEIFAASMAVNTASPVRMAAAYLAHAKSCAQRSVIQLTDQKISNPNPDFFSYSLSKNALQASVKMMAMAAKRAGDRVYGLAPGAILASHDQSTAEAEISHRMNLLARRTSAEEMGEAALFLASATLQSGSTLFVDSGQHLMQQSRDVIYLAREEA